MTPAPDPIPGRRRPATGFLWLIASVALLVPPFLYWSKVPPAERLFVPDTPVDRTLARYAEEWRFLSRARALIPDGATLSVRAEDRQREVSLYILAVGLFPDARPIPGAYYDPPEEQRKRRARFVLSLQCVPPARAGLQPVAVYPEGCVFRDAGAP